MGWLRTTGFSAREPVNRSVEWLFDQERQRERLVIRSPSGLVGWWSFDGKWWHQVGYHRVGDADGSKQVVSQIIKKAARPLALAAEPTPADWMGLQLPLTSDTVLDLLARRTPAAEPAEPWNGLATWRLDLGESGGGKTGLWTYSVRVCPERGGMPVEIALSPSRTNPDFEKIDRLIGSYVYSVEEFREIDDPAAGSRRWLPWKMRRDSKLPPILIEVDQARINPPVSAADFQPPAPQPGTLLVDDTVPGRPRKVAVHDPKAAAALQAADFAAATARPVSTQPVAAARPPDPRFWPKLAAWGGALLLLGCSIWFVVRSRRSA